jgi:hypothetical protein
VLPALFGGITCGLTGLTTYLLTGRNIRWAIFATLVTGLATPVGFYSQMFWEHTLSLAFVMAAIVLLTWNGKKMPWIWPILAGIASSIAMYFRNEVIFVLFGFGLALLIKNRRKGILFGIGFVASSLIWMALNFVTTKSALVPNINIVSNADLWLIGLKQLGKKFIPYLLFSAPLMYGITLTRSELILGTLMTVGVIASAPFKKLRWIGLVCIFGITWLSSIMLFSPVGYRAVHGFIIIAPHALLGVWGLCQFDQVKKFFFNWMVWASGLVYGGVYLLRAWAAAGGLQWGPRYLLSFYPLLVIAGILAVQEYWNQASKAGKVILLVTGVFSVVIGVGFELRGAATVRTTAQFAQQTERGLQAFNDQILLLSCDVDTLVPSIYWDKKAFDILHSDLDSWAHHLQSRGIDSFYRLSFDLCSAWTMEDMAKPRLKNPSGISAESCSAKAYLEGQADYCRPVPIPTAP